MAAIKRQRILKKVVIDNTAAVNKTKNIIEMVLKDTALIQENLYMLKE